MSARVGILECGHAPSEHSEHTTGYGIDREGRRHCYECCAKFERESMASTGKATLYLTQPVDGSPCKVTDWAGKLSFTPNWWTKGRHNMAGVRYDVWFLGPDEDGKDQAVWHGVTYGDQTQICHCRRTKRRARP